MYAIYAVGQSKTPVDSLECSPGFSESFLEQVSVSPESYRYKFVFFGAAKSVFSRGSKTRLSELGPAIMDL